MLEIKGLRQMNRINFKLRYKNVQYWIFNMQLNAKSKKTLWIQVKCLSKQANWLNLNLEIDKWCQKITVSRIHRETTYPCGHSICCCKKVIIIIAKRNVFIQTSSGWFLSDFYGLTGWEKSFLMIDNFD